MLLEFANGRCQTLRFPLVVAVLWAAGATLASAASPARVAFTASIKDVPRAAGGAGAHCVRDTLTSAESAAALDFVVSLRLRNFPDLQARVLRGDRISPGEMAGTYLPLRSDYDRVADWLNANGFTLTLTDKSHTNLFARGTVAQIAAAFAVRFGRVATETDEVTSALSAPSLPSGIGDAVLGVLGLQPHVRLHHSPFTTFAATNVNGMATPADILAAYHVPAGLDGTGQAIAIFTDSLPLASDMTAFWQEAGVNEKFSSYTTVLVNGGPTPSTQAGGLGEATLDVEWSSAMAPGAQVIVYALPNLLASNLVLGCTRILNDGQAGIVSMSFGSPESNQPLAAIQMTAQAFAQLAAAGITLFAASGDSGTNNVPGGRYSSTAPLNVAYPASDPSVISVGGTNLIFDANWTAVNEVVWSDIGTPQGSVSAFATGGGLSANFTRPSWQAGTGVPAGTKRCVPDLAAVAGIATPTAAGGVLVHLQGNVSGGAGTSLAAPVWAGLMACLNQARHSAGLPPLGVFGPTLYSLIGAPGFNDIVSGTNGAYSAGSGYDLCCGVGSPNFTYLVAELAPPTPPSITTQPLSRAVAVGGSVTLTVAASGIDTTYQWLFNGTPLVGATASALTLSNIGLGQAGNYSVRVTDGGGTTTSTPAVLTVAVPPAFTAQPVSLTIATGGSAVFTAVASGIPAPSYQWYLGSTPVSGATGPRLVIKNSSLATAGSYTVVATNSGGAKTSQAAMLTLMTTDDPGRLINLSVLSVVQSSLTMGYVIGGSGAAGSENLLIRATGPALAAPPFNVPGAMTDPMLTVVKQAGSVTIATNAGWGATAQNQAQVTATDTAVGAFALSDPTSLDSALVTQLPISAGGYTATVAGKSGDSGYALTEVYDATPAGTYTVSTPRLVNLSCLTQISAGGTLTVGFVVGGSTAKTVLVRVSGPTLAAAPFNIGGTMSDPKVSVQPLSSASTILAANAGWGGDAQVASVASDVGAFAFASAPSQDSAALVTLAAGVPYTVQVSSASGGGGLVLVEIYEVP